jgi:hypothetical protein
MTALEPKLRPLDAPPCDIQTVEPERLRSWPRRKRHPLHEFADFFAVRLNRLIGDHAWAKRVYWQALRQTEYSEVRMPVGGQIQPRRQTDPFGIGDRYLSAGHGRPPGD